MRYLETVVGWLIALALAGLAIITFRTNSCAPNDIAMAGATVIGSFLMWRKEHRKFLAAQEDANRQRTEREEMEKAARKENKAIAGDAEKARKVWKAYGTLSRPSCLPSSWRYLGRTRKPLSRARLLMDAGRANNPVDIATYPRINAPAKRAVFTHKRSRFSRVDAPGHLLPVCLL